MECSNSVDARVPRLWERPSRARRTHSDGRRQVVVRSRSLRCVADMLERDPRLVVCLVEADWSRVDDARDRADAMGLTDRLSVHHASALRLASVN